MPETLTITDNRTGKTFEAPIEDGAIRATAMKEAGLMSYDPAFLNTASVRSEITFIDGDAGILRYRGYPIEQLAERSTYLETAYLLIHGELPDNGELAHWSNEITYHTFLHENVKALMEGFRYDAHPMGMLVSMLGALSTFYPEAARVDDPEVRMQQVVRLIAKVPTIAAWSYRHSRGLPYVYPDNDLGFTANFLSMMFRMAEPRYHAEPALERALEVLFILHADHEQNCSANAMRSIGSSKVDPYSAMAGAAAALYGPLHGGANEEVLRMLVAIGSVDAIPAFVERVKAGEGRLMGFGHRVYKNYDPRAKIIKQVADDVFEVTGRNPLLDIALELEKIA
ncbi:MAG TPA: citrate/2-methylcitrate synthase, partial [Gaiellaceae bacterium]|nr:citrate/2-methylcitrate synthase [Gaiellaceae bacterium]